MNAQRLPLDDPQEWLNRARSNLTRAKSQLTGVYLEDLCFDAQQAAEKAIKALLIHLGKRFPYTHDLMRLLTLVEQAGQSVPESVRRAGALSDYAVESRYPGLAEPVTQEEYEEAESVPGGQTYDLTLLRQTGVIGQLAEGKAAMLDKAYDGLQKDYRGTRLYLPFKARRNHPLTEEQKAYSRFLARYRIVGEHTLACTNRFHVLRQAYRHQHSEHSRVMRIVAGLVNRRIAERPLKVYAVAGV